MKTPRNSFRQFLLALCAGGSLIAASGTVLANHPVLVEGERDFDGDGLVGTAEDTDNGTDRVFGTLAAALAAANGAANTNGRITIVTSGRFAEQLFITGANGNVTIEAAPGVEATIDAVVAGDRGTNFVTGNNVTRQDVPGIIINAASNRRIVLRNLVVRNWSEGISVLGDSHVSIDNCRLEGNRDYGIRVSNNAAVAITGCQINSTGFRVGMAANNVANPGNGIEFEDSSTGLVCKGAVTGNAKAGIKNDTASFFGVEIRDVCLFDNHPNIQLPKHKRNDNRDD